jgi:hypothetical protein
MTDVLKKPLKRRAFLGWGGAVLGALGLGARVEAQEPVAVPAPAPPVSLDPDAGANYNGGASYAAGKPLLENQYIGIDTPADGAVLVHKGPSGVEWVAPVASADGELTLMPIEGQPGLFREVLSGKVLNFHTLDPDTKYVILDNLRDTSEE